MPSSARSTPGSPSSSPAATSPTLERVADDALRHPRGLSGTGSSVTSSGSTRARCPSRPAPLRSTAPPRCSAARCPWPGIAGDQQAALFGQALRSAGLAKNTYGTGSFVLLNTGHEAPEPRAGCSRRWPGESAGHADYALEAASSSPARPSSGCATGSGSSTRRPRPRRSRPRSRGTTASTSSRPSPAWARPTGTPTRAGRSSACTRGAGRAHLARAALEAIAYQTVDAVRAQEAASGKSPSS